jgi:hypothetical protein
VGVEIDDLLPQFSVESRHHRNHQDQHGDAERDAENGDQRDDGKKGAFRFEITQRQEKAERQFQAAVMLPTNAKVSSEENQHRDVPKKSRRFLRNYPR